MKNKYFLGTLVFILAWTNLPVYSIADEYNDTIATMRQQEEQTQQAISDLQKQSKETQDAINNLQSQKQKTQSNVENLKNQKEGFQSQINEYSNKLNGLNKEISSNVAKMDEVSERIITLDNELMEAKEQEKERYKNLKLRMKSSYENGGERGMMRTLLEAGSFHDFLTKVEYLNAIVAYDNRKITELQTLQKNIKEKTEEVKVKEAELNEIQSVLDEQHDELTQLTNTVNGQLKTTNKNLTSEQNNLADYDKKLEELDKKMKELNAQSAKAQAELAKQIANRLALTKEDTSGSYSASDSELVMLAATIQAEADGESYTGKLGVGSVIMNRVKSSAFPNSVEGVITQQMQFASWRSGKVSLIMQRGPNAICVKAAQEVLSGKRIGDYLFFMTRYWADHYGIAEYQMIGNHAFFYRWVVKEKPPEEPEQQEQPAEAPAEEHHDENNSGEEEHHEEEHHDEESDDNSDDDDDSDDE